MSAAPKRRRGRPARVQPPPVVDDGASVAGADIVVTVADTVADSSSTLPTKRRRAPPDRYAPPAPPPVSDDEDAMPADVQDKSTADTAISKLLMDEVKPSPLKQKQPNPSAASQKCNATNADHLLTAPDSSLLGMCLKDYINMDTFTNALDVAEQTQLLALLPTVDYRGDETSSETLFDADQLRRFFTSSLHLNESIELFGSLLGAGAYTEDYAEYLKEVADEKAANKLLGASSGIMLADIFRAGLLNAGDAVSYCRTFKSCNVLVKAELQTVGNDGDDVQFRFLKDKKADVISVSTMTALETIVLDKDGRIAKDCRPNGNAWRSFSTSRGKMAKLRAELSTIMSA